MALTHSGVYSQSNARVSSHDLHNELYYILLTLIATWHCNIYSDTRSCEKSQTLKNCVFITKKLFSSWPCLCHNSPLLIDHIIVNVLSISLQSHKISLSGSHFLLTFKLKPPGNTVPLGTFNQKSWIYTVHVSAKLN